MSNGTIRDPYSFFQGAQFINARGDIREMSWGLNSGPLVLANKVSELECSKNNAGEYDGITPPWWSNSEKAQTRYCVDKLEQQDLNHLQHHDGGGTGLRDLQRGGQQGEF